MNGWIVSLPEIYFDEILQCYPTIDLCLFILQVALLLLWCPELSSVPRYIFGLHIPLCTTNPH